MPWTCSIMQVDSRSGVYIFSRSRGDNRATELLLLRIRARRETFDLGRSSQRWTNTVLAVDLLNLNVSSTSPHKPKVSLLSPHKAEASQRSQPLTRVISAAQLALRLCVKSLIIKGSIGAQYKSDKVRKCDSIRTLLKLLKHKQRDL